MRFINDSIIEAAQVPGLSSLKKLGSLQRSWKFQPVRGCSNSRHDCGQVPPGGWGEGGIQADAGSVSLLFDEKQPVDC